MALRTRVKISKVNNLSDARYCAGMGVEMLGFNLEPGTLHYTAPEKFRELSEWVAGVQFVAEFSQATAETIKRLLPEYKVQYIQTDRADQLEALQEHQLPLILRIPVQENTSPESIERILEKYKQEAAFFLLQSDEAEEDSLAAINEALPSLAEKYPILLGIGVSAATVSELIETIPLKGIVLEGGEELRAGYKDFDELADVLESLEVDEAY